VLFITLFFFFLFSFFLALLLAVHPLGLRMVPTISHCHSHLFRRWPPLLFPPLFSFCSGAKFPPFFSLLPPFSPPPSFFFPLLSRWLKLFLFCTLLRSLMWSVFFLIYAFISTRAGAACDLFTPKLLRGFSPSCPLFFFFCFFFPFLLSPFFFFFLSSSFLFSSRVLKFFDGRVAHLRALSPLVPI